MFFYYQIEENIEDKVYNKYHDNFEQKEIDYRQKIFCNYEKKQSKKMKKKLILETQKSYEHLYSINEENDKDSNDNVLIVKIKLE